MHSLAWPYNIHDVHLLALIPEAADEEPGFGMHSLAWL